MSCLTTTLDSSIISEGCIRMENYEQIPPRGPPRARYSLSEFETKDKVATKIVVGEYSSLHIIRVCVPTCGINLPQYLFHRFIRCQTSTHMWRCAPGIGNRPEIQIVQQELTGTHPFSLGCRGRYPCSKHRQVKYLPRQLLD